MLSQEISLGGTYPSVIGCIPIRLEDEHLAELHALIEQLPFLHSPTLPPNGGIGSALSPLTSAALREYQSVQRCFFTRRSLFLLLWKVTDGDIALADLHDFLLAIQAQAPNSYVLIVGTHSDFVREQTHRFPRDYLSQMDKQIQMDELEPIMHFNEFWSLAIDRLSLRANSSDSTTASGGGGADAGRPMHFRGAQDFRQACLFLRENEFIQLKVHQWNLEEEFEECFVAEAVDELTFASLRESEVHEVLARHGRANDLVVHQRFLELIADIKRSTGCSELL